MVDAVHKHAISLMFHAKYDAMGEVDEMPDLEGELLLLRNDGASLGQFLERIDRFNQTTKPAFRGFGFLPDITNESNEILGILQCRICDINVECQASPEVSLRPDGRAGPGLPRQLPSRAESLPRFRDAPG